MTNPKPDPECVGIVSLETHRLSEADLHQLIQVLMDLCNSLKLSEEGGEAMLEVLAAVEAVYYRGTSNTPAEALRKVLTLAGGEIESSFSFGTKVVADSTALFERVEMFPEVSA